MKSNNRGFENTDNSEFLTRRGISLANQQPPEKKSSKLLGFRSNTTWKKVLSVLYLAGIILFFIIGVFSDNPLDVTAKDKFLSKVEECFLFLAGLLPYIWLSDFIHFKLRLIEKGKKITVIVIAVLIAIFNIVIGASFDQFKSEAYKTAFSQQEEEKKKDRQEKEQHRKLEQQTKTDNTKEEKDTSSNTADSKKEQTKETVTSTTSATTTKEKTFNIPFRLAYTVPFVEKNKELPDLDIYADDVIICTLKREETKEFTAALTEGEHKMSVYKAGTQEKNDIINYCIIECQNGTLIDMELSVTQNAVSFLDLTPSEPNGNESQDEFENEEEETEKTEIDQEKIDAMTAFEKYGKAKYPYGFKCKWATGLIYCGKRPEGYYFIKVYVKIENAYGNKIKTVAEGKVEDGTVYDFFVY